MTIFQKNKRRGHKFIFSVLLFGFCMARIAALTMRIVWAERISNINVALAASIFVAAGVLLLFVINLLFAQRTLRAYHPRFGWNKRVGYAFRGLIGSVVALLIMVVTSTVYSLFTLDQDARQKCREVQLFAGVYLAVMAFLPIPIVVTTLLWPGKNQREVEKFGQGKMRTKLALLLTTSTLLSLGAAFRAGINFVPKPLMNPAWYHSKACFYVFNFAIEIIVVYLYALSRFDRRFHVPNGSSAPGHYSGSVSMGKDDKGAHNSEESRGASPGREVDGAEDGEPTTTAEVTGIVKEHKGHAYDGDIV